ncbi:MAG: lipopolysaccharide heptosyltransferase I [Proteobacteria bacterium]|nr:lipopolysaccharide heptosyltransferase I [Pseudomonadota bacterium]
MKRALIVKMSSMGDVIHTLPALTDAHKVHPEIEFDWVVEPGFAEIPRWHKAVRRVISAPLRRFRKMPWQTFAANEWHQLLKQLRYTDYDVVIDAQGLVKSAVLTHFTKGKRFGLNWKSAKEPVASLLYHQKIGVPKNQHAVQRVRQLFADAFNYTMPSSAPDYGIDKTKLTDISYGDNTVIFLHGTTWSTKHWPQKYWYQLAKLAQEKGYQVLLPWGNEAEHQRALEIKNFCDAHLAPIVLPKLTLGEITTLIAKACGIVAVDTGLGHVAAAMATPTVSLYGPTSPDLTGAYGPKQTHLKVDAPCSPCFAKECKRGQHFETMPPCFESLPPQKVWQALEQTMAQAKESV